MNTFLKGMNIGPKFAVSIGALATVVSLIGLIIIYQQEQDKLMGLLEQRGKLLETQIQITRAYIAQNYVGKIKKSKDSVEINVKPGKRYVLPISDVCFLPIPATTSELLAKFIHDKLKEIYKNKKIVVKVGESRNSIASYEE